MLIPVPDMNSKGRRPNFLENLKKKYFLHSVGKKKGFPFGYFHIYMDVTIDIINLIEPNNINAPYSFMPSPKFPPISKNIFTA